MKPPKTSESAKSPKPSAWSEIDRIRLGLEMQEDSVPPNAITVADYANKYKTTERTAGFHLDRMVRLGLMLKGKKRCPTNNRKSCYYWPKESK